MAKFYDKVGFILNTLTAPGVYAPVPIEKFYYGDFVKTAVKLQSGDGLNDEVTVNNRIEIVADSYLTENRAYLKYVVLDNQKVKVTSITYVYPRLHLSLGGVWNG